ncbi:MAG: trigger factor, partial [Clostridia bacterium]|nr:trigger factor [Clostridia bacterium]
MKYDLLKKDNGIVEATIQLDAKEWSDSVEKAYQKNKAKYSVQGFRKGHAPKNVIEKTYGQGVFVQDALDDVFYMAYSQILREHEDIQPYQAPKMDVKKLDESGIEIALEIPSTPQFTLGEYKGLEFKKTVAEVTDEQLQSAIERELMRGSRLVETNKPVKNDDIVTLDFEGFIDGKAFEGGKAEKYQLKIGSHSFIDTFEDQLVGLNVGDEKDVNVTFPTEYHQADLAGKPAVFKVKIHNVREREMPELNDEFVQNSSEFDTVEAYKNDVRAKLVKQAEDNAEIEVDNRMLDTIVDNTKIELPDAMVDVEADRMIKGMEAQLSYQGATLEMYAQYMGKTVEQLKAEQRMTAERQVKGRLVLEKLIRSENLDITIEDIDAKIAEIATTQGTTAEEYKKEIGDNGINQIGNELLMKKLLDFLRQN